MTVRTIERKTEPSIPSGLGTRVVFDNDWNEYIVQAYLQGRRHADADYHTDNKFDALGTASALRNEIDFCQCGDLHISEN